MRWAAIRASMRCADLLVQFDAVQARFEAEPDVTGAALYAFACDLAERSGWRFGGKIAGHIVAEFPHKYLRGRKEHQRIAAENPTRLRDPASNGRERYWILEVHLVSRDDMFGGFYERLMHRA